jgi:thioredoxin:protein disulfide reductase
MRSFFLALLVTWQASAKLNTNPMQITSVQSDRQELRSGESSSVTIKFDIAPGFHAYLDQFRVEPHPPIDLGVAIQDIGPQVEFFDRISQRQRKGLSGRGEILAVLTWPRLHAGPHTAEIGITYQACSTTVCLLPKTLIAPVSMTVLEPESSGPLDIDLDKFGINIWLTVFLAGILTSFTPCVFPMIPITLAVLRARHVGHGRRRGFALSLSYVFGIAITYALLGLLAASTGSLFGAYLGHPAVALGLAFLFILLALSTLGLFTVETPDFIRRRIFTHKTQGGLLGAFMAGTVAGVVASPCVGPVLAAILTYVAKTQNLMLGFALLFVFALGLGQLFLWIGTFSSLQKLLPKSGRWLSAVKYAFALSFFALAIFYGRIALPILFPPKTSPTIPLPEISSDESTHGWPSLNEKALAKAKNDSAPVLIDFYADWCAACHELEVRTFSDPEIRQALKSWRTLRFDATRSSPAFDDWRQRFQIVGLPHVVFIDAKGRWHPELTLTGFENAADFARRLKSLEKESQK